MSSNPDDRPDGVPPFEELLRSMFGDQADDVLREMRERGMDPAALLEQMPDKQTAAQVMDHIRRLMSTPVAGPVNTEVAHNVARQVAVLKGDPFVNGAQAQSVVEALTVADLWLDAVTDIAPAGAVRHAWSRSQWVEATLSALETLIAPVADSMVDALATLLADQLDEHPGLGDSEGLPGLALPGQEVSPEDFMRRVGSTVFGMQIGQAAGALSREVFGATDIGLPLLTDDAEVMVPTNVEAFAEGLDAPLGEVRYFLALREAAHARLFTHVGWLRGHLLGLVEAYARGITIDMEELENRLLAIDISDAAQMQQALSGGIFDVTHTPAQQAVLLRLETTLALVEGWVDEVSARAALPHLPHVIALREMIGRRRASGGPAEHTFATLVGLELRPRRSRDAAALWRTIERESGQEGRDGVWAHPDLLPDTEDLDNPEGYATRREAQRIEQADVDRALAEIFDEHTRTGVENSRDDAGARRADDAARDASAGPQDVSGTKNVDDEHSGTDSETDDDPGGAGAAG